MTKRDPLEQFIENVCIETHLRVQDDLGDGFVRLRSEEAERRQALQDIQSSEDILLEMLRNSRDAHATHIYVAVGRRDNTRYITVLDDGDGIPEHLHEIIFEPRVTSKLNRAHMDKWGIHGRGMALYSISQNCKRASVMASKPGNGCAIAVESDVLKLKEKTDQSSFPVFNIDKGSLKVLGPKNMIRTACEFALESRHDCFVYIGSATEIAAAIYSYGVDTVSLRDRLFSRIDELPVCCRLSAEMDPEEFAQIASGLGLELSSRSARRIMNNEIEAPYDLLHLIRESIASDSSDSGNKVAKDSADYSTLGSATQKKIVITGIDQSEFAQAVYRAYLDLADKYYLDSSVRPDLSVRRNVLNIRIPLIPVD